MFDPLPDAEPSRVLAELGELSLACVHREYPYAWIQVLQGPEDLGLPRERTPVFCGSFDWHSSVHTHWTLVRLARLYPQSDLGRRAVEALGRSLTAENLAAELLFLEPLPSFERSYGVAWLFALHAEVSLATDLAGSRAWKEGLAPLVQLSRDRFIAWLTKLPYPIRSGEHSQTAFAMGLAIDAATVSGDQGLRDALAARARCFYDDDCDAPLRYEPSGHDFLSPAVAEADLMRRVLAPVEYSAWLDAFWPALAAGKGLELAPVVSPDRSDGKLAHLDGLNLSRAWMLDAIAGSLDKDDPRGVELRRLSVNHAKLGLQFTDGEFYEGGHWLASFAVYLVTQGFREFV